ncbi:MAG: DUF1800 domain-containing protein [Pseudomonadota bacterium]
MSKPSIALNRFGYGLRYGERPPSDPARYLLAQIDGFDPSPAGISARADMSAKPGEILQMLRQLRRQRRQNASPQSTQMAPMMESDTAADPFNGLPPEVRQSYVKAGQFLSTDVGLRTNVAVTSPTPFAERLVHFWSNHFSVSARKPGTHYLVGDLEFRAIRPHISGRFSDMLKAAVLHPAMLLYLDQFQSVGPNSPSQQRRRGRAGGRERGLNENLAREILELHTLGVDGGYTQADVTEFARALTGWSVQGIARVERFSAPQKSGAAFVAVAHEPGTRQVLGNRYSQADARQAIAILDDLATHPATARFIATKLARHFAGDTPPTSLVDRLETDFQRTGGDLSSLTQTLISAPEVWVEGPVKFRQPYEWFIAMLRLTRIDNMNDRRLSGILRQIGQLPWHAPSPAGYDDIEGIWAGPDALFRRAELSERIARSARADDVLGRAEAAFPGALSDNTRTWLSRAESGRQGLGLLLISPEMLRR